MRQIFFCFLSAALLALLQFLYAQAPSLLGVASQELSLGFVQFDLGIVAFELAKIFTLVAGFLLLFRNAYRTYQIKIRSNAGKKLWLACTLLMITSGYLSTLLRYPAAFESFLPAILNRILYRSAFSLSPLYLEVGVGIWCLWVLLHCQRKTQILVASIGAVALFFTLRPLSAPRAVTQKAPDVILIGVDALRTDRANNPAIMPALTQAVQKEGFLSFDNHIVGIPRTFPSWVEMLQGKPAAQTGIRHMFPDLKEKRPFFTSIASLLRDEGYATGVISDFAGDIFPRFQTGFEKIDAPTMNIQSLLQMSVDLVFPLFLPLILRSPGRDLFPAVLESPSGSESRFLVERAQRMLQSFPAEKPAFLTLFFSTVHFPYAAPWPWYTKFTDPHYTGRFYFQKNPDLYEKAQYPEADIRQVRALYDGAAYHVDSAIGAFFAWLKQQGRWDNSLIILTADHGQELFEYGSHHGHGEHLRGENVIKVPFFVKLPNQAPAAVQHISFISRSIDMAPTIYGAVHPQQPTPEMFHGINLLPHLRKDPRLTAYTESGLWFSRTGVSFYQKERLDYPSITELLQFNPAETGDIVLRKKYQPVVTTAKHRSLTTDRFKLMYTPTHDSATFHLYDRIKDPENRIDVQAQYPDVFKSLQQQLQQWIAKNERHAHWTHNFVVPN